jgi:hypothetical protein
LVVVLVAVVVVVVVVVWCIGWCSYSGKGLEVVGMFCGGTVSVATVEMGIRFGAAGANLDRGG